MRSAHLVEDPRQPETFRCNENKDYGRSLDYSSFYGYYHVAYRQVYTPDYLREDHTVRVETNLYAPATPEGEFVGTGPQRQLQPELRRQGHRRRGEAGGEGIGESADLLTASALAVPAHERLSCSCGNWCTVRQLS
jgi:hypothetical protein